MSLVNKLIDESNAFLIAPLDANTLAKIANGIADNLIVFNFSKLFKSITF